MTRALLGREHFIDLDDVAYFYTGAHAPAVHAVEEAMVASYRAKSGGPRGRAGMFTLEERARASVAGLVRGATAGDVAFLGDASTAWSAVANGWRWQPGDNVVLNEYEHPSVFAPWLRLRQAGLEVRFVRRREDWEMPTEDIAAACDERTVAIALSHVGYVTGLRHDVAAVSRAADARGIPVLLDVSHSLGLLDVDLDAVALAISASYKWTLGPYGVGVVAWNRERLPGFEPGAVGWRSVEDIFRADRFADLDWSPDARRFQMGAPSLSGIAGLGAAAEIIGGLGLPAVHAHSARLVGAVHAGLRERGLAVTTPADPDRRAGSVAFLHPDGERVAAALEDLGVHVWGGDGRVRASCHVMNDDDDVDRLLLALDRVLADHPLGAPA
ncbi:aminotransferase class V-fold PLP-dependent enzyme [Georgenia faecalis]|uniref:Aminotransferase class V-fold PLP-dependent enzyme n=1 Tax=Georgenia faecalis TaxID=2483799 RepID=A0ABV9DAD5_9MICO|nr:aminotransferase class V-fold PLP-dependent enzyme [Georgenia faecalis]